MDAEDVIDVSGVVICQVSCPVRVVLTELLMRFHDSDPYISEGLLYFTQLAFTGHE
jgi:hypothetical protein